MVINGDIDVWSKLFPDELVPQVIQLFLDSWKTFSTNQTDERKITKEFHAILNNNQRRSKLPFTIDLELSLYNKKGTEEIGRLDIRIIHGHDREVYFSFECKRLRINFTSGFKTLAREYVTEGMYRYFTGQYAQGLDKGGMLGYVMDGNWSEAIKDVQKAIESKRSQLYMKDSETIKSSYCFNLRQVKETSHQYGPDNKFTLYHIFLPMTVALNNNKN